MSFIPRITNVQDSLLVPLSADFPSRIVCNDGRSIQSLHSNSSILSIIVDSELLNAPSPKIMDLRLGISMHHSNIQYQINTLNHK